ncbi:MAG: hypothetical protein GY778_22240, partial [bacterium]|nr:hypothetical protein [bacterium]
SDDTGGAIHVDDDLNLTNSILWNNTAPVGPEVYNAGTSSIIRKSLVKGSGGSGAGWDPTLGTDAGGNIDADPVFGGLPGEEFRLSWVSPCVNAGDNGAPGLPATDFAGNPRIEDGVVDMGVYEFRCAPGPVAYFDADAAGSNDGSSWEDAYNVLRLGPVGPTAGCPGITELWVAEGTYHATYLGDRSASLLMANGIEAYGGFAGDETSRSERMPGIYPTVLSGEINSPSILDNSYHVLVATGTDSTAVVDGFVVEGGNADGQSPHNRGGGMLNNPGSPTVRNVVFRDNAALVHGGGMYNYIGSSPRLANIVFDGNSAYTNWG